MTCPKCGNEHLLHYLDAAATVKCEKCGWSKATNPKYAGF